MNQVDVIAVMETSLAYSEKKLAREQLKAARHAAVRGERNEAADRAVGFIAAVVAKEKTALAAVTELIEAGLELDDQLDGPAIAHRLRAALANCGASA